ncbi:protoporphyrinogen/coproporphyrinogen oxidase [Streptomyces zingiberis]|uniref:FAD-dependent oxidoreductase n=1 Tax=Streptomyces zingiberis TaxID=2053010 RepID=A0ABX1C2K9_9ACTN|nr:NAD(P)/FAD-dependent oxidoreductase [Streptomyces zingiberis]NJQ01129.1 FAD-dependent oxidoreductase [Streptomyces zingiberis]
MTGGPRTTRPDALGAPGTPAAGPAVAGAERAASGGRPHVIVAGAGIAGLTSAFLLQRRGCRVTVLESGGPEEVGGRMASVRRDGFFIDTGASLLSRRYHAMLRLAELAGVGDRLLPSSDLIGLMRDRRVHHLHVGSLPRMAAGLLRFAPFPADLPKLMLDHLRVRRSLDWYDMSAAARHDGESVAGYALRRGLRPGTVDHLLDPLCMLASLQDVERTSSVAPFMLLNSLLGGGGLFTFRGGVGLLPRLLAAQLPVTYHARVRQVEEDASGVRVTWRPGDGGERTERADACVLAVPVSQAPELYGQMGREFTEFFRQVEYTGSVHVAFGLDRPTAERAVMVNAPRAEHPALVGVILPHNTAPGRVPEGRGLVMAHFRGSWSDRHRDLPEDRLVDHARAALRALRLVPETENHTVMTHVMRPGECVVFRRPGDYRELARLSRAWPAGSRVHLAGGDYFTQSSTHHSICSAARTARRVWERLEAAAPAQAGPSARVPALSRTKGTPS